MPTTLGNARNGSRTCGAGRLERPRCSSGKEARPADFISAIPTAPFHILSIISCFIIAQFPDLFNLSSLAHP